MENILKITRYQLIIVLAFLFLGTSNAQKNNLYVLNYKGSPKVKTKDSVMPVSRGTTIKKKTLLIMGRDDIAYLINNSGEVFEIYQTGTFKQKELLKLEPIKGKSSFNKKLASYLLSQVTNRAKKGYTKSGVVYRGDYVQLLQPLDSTMLYTDEVSFGWKAIENKTKPYYFVLREKGSQNPAIIGTYDNKLNLVADNVTLKIGITYEWSVVESKYENLNNIDYSSFSLLSEKDYSDIKQENDELQQFLNSIGFSETEIQSFLCTENKTCFD